MNNQKIGDVSNNYSSVVGNGNADISISDTAPLGNEILTAVPYIVHESDMARQERHIKRIFVTAIISNVTLLAVIVALVVGFLSFISQYEFEEIELSSEGGGNANYIGEDGNIYNGSYQG